MASTMAIDSHAWHKLEELCTVHATPDCVPRLPHFTLYPVSPVCMCIVCVPVYHVLVVSFCMCCVE